ncbi:MAG TPA: hypothetical protein VMB50_14675 [Myxococcales bacterium]|nr:hypothetical protein [Myxococcales bacterium]
MSTKALAILAGLSLGGCAENLAVPAASQTYQMVAEGTPNWTAEERALAEQMNERLAKEGFPKAEPGASESSLAALEVAILRSKRWSTAHRRGDASLSLDTDEQEGTEYPKAHMLHRLLARGTLWGGGESWGFAHVDDFVKRTLWPSDLDKLWPWARPSQLPVGTLRIGVAVLGDGPDGRRYFAVVLRDDRVDLTQGPPRTAEPGSKFVVSGQVHDDELKPLKLAVWRPDGTVDQQVVDIGSDGRFEASYQLPKDTGRYVVALGGRRSIPFEVPVFVGVAPEPWPPVAAPDAIDPQTTRDSAKELARALFAWRKAQKLPAVTLPEALCAFAKAEAKRYVEEDANPAKAERAHKDWALRVRAAGLDPDKVFVYHARMPLSPSDENNLLHSWESFLARIPWDPFSENELRKADLSQIGIGAVPEPQASVDDPKFVDVVWIAVEGSGAPSASN